MTPTPIEKLLVARSATDAQFRDNVLQGLPGAAQQIVKSSMGVFGWNATTCREDLAPVLAQLGNADFIQILALASRPGHPSFEQADLRKAHNIAIAAIRGWQLRDLSADLVRDYPDNGIPKNWTDDEERSWRSVNFDHFANNQIARLLSYDPDTCHAITAAEWQATLMLAWLGEGHYLGEDTGKNRAKWIAQQCINALVVLHLVSGFPLAHADRFLEANSSQDIAEELRRFSRSPGKLYPSRQLIYFLQTLDQQEYVGAVEIALAALNTRVKKLEQTWAHNLLVSLSADLLGLSGAAYPAGKKHPTVPASLGPYFGACIGPERNGEVAQ